MNRVKLRAAQIIEDKRGEDDSIDIGTIRAALDPKSIFPKQNEKAAVPVRMEADIEQAASGVLAAVAERDADDADRTAVEPFATLTAAADVDFGAVFSIGAADLFFICKSGCRSKYPVL